MVFDPHATDVPASVTGPGLGYSAPVMTPEERLRKATMIYTGDIAEFGQVGPLGQQAEAYEKSLQSDSPLDEPTGEVYTGEQDLGEQAGAPLEGPRPTEAQSRLQMALSALGRGGGPVNLPKATPLPGEGTEAVLAQQADMVQRRAAEIGEIQENVATAEIAKNTARATFHEKVQESRKLQDSLLQEQKDAVLYPDAPTGENVSVWVAERKKWLQDPEVTPEAKEKISAELERAANPNAMQEVMGGSVWRTVLSSLALGMGAFGAAMTGGPNTAAQIIFRAIDQRQAMHKAKAGRKQRVLRGELAKGELGIARQQEDFAAQQSDRMHQLQMYDMALEEVSQRYGDEETMLKIAGVREQLAVQMDQWSQEFGLKSATSAATLGLRREQNRTAKMGLGLKLAEKAAGPKGFGGLEYKPNAAQLEVSERKQVRDKMSIYKRAQHHMDALIKAAEQTSVGKYASWTEESKKMNQHFAAMIDVIREDKNWGARFEQTEMDVLIPGYLGKAEPADFGYWLENLKQTRDAFDGSFDATLDAYDMQLPGAQQQGAIPHGALR